jgi:putative transposase
VANTYTQLHIQFVFAVKYRQGLIQPEWKERLFQYIAGIFRRNEHKMLQVNGMPDHIHILAGLRPHQSFSALVQNVKAESTKWIKAEGLCRHFAWQEGFGAFSYSKSQVPRVIRYIQNQEAHHRKECFHDEYLRLLEAAGVEYDKQYIFKEPL